VLCSFVALRPRLSSGAVTGLVGVLAVVLVGAGVVSANVGERTIEPEHGTGPVQEVARGTAFHPTKLDVITDRDVVIKFRNDDPTLIHNVAVYTDESASRLVYFGREINGLGSRTYEFEANAGTYFYRCEFHPQQMTGTLEVERVEEHSANRS
jgi:plastocyanin